eukprot:SM000157S02087  [mRNA]  locus=s157:220049:222294:+ [translate_table: standard]
MFQSFDLQASALPPVTGVDRVGAVARRRPGEKVHFCWRCNLPVAIYGRLDRCKHAYCLTCATEAQRCYLCGADTGNGEGGGEGGGGGVTAVGRDEGLFICGAPGCLHAFLLRPHFVAHLRREHGDLARAPAPRPQPLLPALPPVTVKGEPPAAAPPVAVTRPPPSGNAPASAPASAAQPWRGGGPQPPPGPRPLLAPPAMAGHGMPLPPHLPSPMVMDFNGGGGNGGPAPMRPPPFGDFGPLAGMRPPPPAPT